MGLFDSIKKKLGVDKVAPPPVMPEPEVEADEDAGDDVGDAAEESEGYDLAGFDPDDEDAFFEAVLHMESDGQFGGTDESRARIMQKYGIRSRSHWQTVKDSVYSALVRRLGSFEEVSQRETNWRMGQMQNHMSGQVARAAAGGELNPVEGVSLDAWAALNAAIVGGANPDDLLKGAGIEPGRWQRVSAEWNARMARDTTFAITTVYGQAFQNASQGKYAAYAREATAARTANRDLTMEPPLSVEQYFDAMFAQSYATKQGQNPVDALKSKGLTIVDWTDLGGFMGYYFMRNHARQFPYWDKVMRETQARYEAQYPGVKPDLDIQF